MPLKAMVPLLGLLLSCLEMCVCYPNGSVAFSCGNLMPVHPPFTPSNTNPPFTLTTSSSTYTPGGVLTVTVEVVPDSTVEFQGFLLQARSRRGNGLIWPVGRFTNINPGLFTALHCNNMENSSVSQATGAKRKKVQLTWEAPSNSDSGEIYFSASLVQDYTSFWVELNSTTVRRASTGNSASLVSSSSVLLVISLLSLSANR